MVREIPLARVTALKYLTDLKTSKHLDIVAVNASWTSSAKSKALLNAIKLAGQANILIVAAAGNDHLNADKYKTYPASYDPSADNYDGTPGISYNNVISVAAIGPDGALASFSNYGFKTVHLAAPGVGIWSTWPKDDYKSIDGTSMAAPTSQVQLPCMHQLTQKPLLANPRRDPCECYTRLAVTGQSRKPAAPSISPPLIAGCAFSDRCRSNPANEMKVPHDFFFVTHDVALYAR